ncbi:uncharacterized protein LOC105386570 [Plutella xylostella]|uniref:uncharacterized protein LOC105386570 n=1 Tax=Plutella xylostella TaxID=51655 RepID=UPI002032195E|nr:uncharacterized protein LOC105386570 [Plutella xylostella]
MFASTKNSAPKVSSKKTRYNENALYPNKSDLKRYLLAITDGLNYFIEASIEEVYEKLNIMLWLSLMNDSKLGNNEEVLVHGLKRFNSDDGSVSDIQMARFQQQWHSGCDYLKQSLFQLDRVNETFYVHYPCIASLAKNRRELSGNINSFGLTHCRLKKICRGIVKKWPNFGLYLVSRLMMLVIANHMRGCAITVDDGARTKALCNQAFIESHYLAKNNKNMHSLMIYVALCSASGERKFLQRRWFETLLDLQVNDGYFDGAIGRRYRHCAVNSIAEIWKFIPIDLMKWDVEQFTAVSLAALSSAVRYIVQGQEAEIGREIGVSAISTVKAVGNVSTTSTSTVKPYGGYAPPGLEYL